MDEIPQLVNVLIGDMSIVGPRPMLWYQYNELTEEQRHRFLVKPGITGLAQVSGRNALPWSQRIRLDCRYVEELSLWLDLGILIRTVPLVLSGDSVDSSLPEEEVEDFGAAQAAKRKVS